METSRWKGQEKKDIVTYGKEENGKRDTSKKSHDEQVKNRRYFLVSRKGKKKEKVRDEKRVKRGRERTHNPKRLLNEENKS